MPHINATVWLFDPVVPFQKVAAMSPGIDTWHDHVLITKELRSKIRHVAETGETRLNLSGGMSISAPSIELGLQIGHILIPKVRALVVDQGAHDVLLGSEVFGQIFKERREEPKGADPSSEPPDSGPEPSDPDETFRYTSRAKEDSSALSLELYPVETPFPLQQFENLIRNQRVLFNIALIASKAVQIEGLSGSEVDQVIENDVGIPSNVALQLSCIESGSIWISLKSGSQSTLKYLGSIFETGASAKLAEQLANAKSAEGAAQISKATRNAVAAQIRAEQEKLRVENIQQTYETWRKELRSRLSFLDELIEQTADKAIVERLKERKNEAILRISEQQMVAIVRNIPGSFVSYDDGVLSLPPPPFPRG